MTALERRARVVRATCVQMAFDAKEGHLSSALSCADILVALFRGWLQVFPDEPKHPARDRFILSKGHACTALYAVMADMGYFPKQWLNEYATNDSPLPNHPCKHALPMLEYSSGSLGHGLGVATGVAYGLRMDRSDSRVAVLMSDGECNEGSVWEAAMFAAAQKLDNLIAIVDYNGVQAVGRSDEIMAHASLEGKFTAFGWRAITVDGNNMGALLKGLAEVADASGRPSAIIAKTRGGAGVPFMEDDILWHYRTPSKDELVAALRVLECAPIHKTEVSR
ncbi:MAG: transketolase [Deltaproteobacteria bacterium]|nr:transketolase [Deltaproteobacteria bacterium]